MAPRCRNPAIEDVFPSVGFLPALAVAVALAASSGYAQDARAPGAPVQIAAAKAGKAPPTGPAHEFGSYLAGYHAFRQRDFGVAASYMNDALRAQPLGRDLLRRALVAKLASGQADSARVLARRLLAIEPDSPLAKLSLTAGDFKAGRFESARSRLSTIGGRGPDAIYASLLSAWAEAGSGRYDTAVEILQRPAGDRNPLAVFRHHSALILDLANRPEAAERHYLDALRQMPQPTARMILAVGSFYRRKGNPDEAERHYTAFLAERDRAPLIESALADLRAGKPAARIVSNAIEGAAEVFFVGANFGIRTRSTDFALVYGQFALDLKPQFPSARVLVGRTLQSAGREESAIEAYRLVDKASPLSWSARLRRADGLSRLGREEEAIEILRRMVAERTERTDALTTLGDLFRTQKRFSESVEAYDAAVSRVGSIEPRHWRLLFSRGIALERSRNWPRAERDFLAALELSPNEPYLLNYLGYSWADQGIKLERALTLIERAVELEPQSGAIVDSLGWALYRMGDYDGAVEKLERAAELEPLDPTVNDHLGDAYWRVGRRNEASFQWRRALDLDPEPDQVEIIEGKIARGLAGPKSGGEAR